MMGILNIKGVAEALYRRLRERAAQTRRSTAEEVMRILGRTLREPHTRSILELDGLGRELWQGEAAEHVRRERQTWTN